MVFGFPIFSEMFDQDIAGLFVQTSLFERNFFEHTDVGFSYHYILQLPMGIVQSQIWHSWSFEIGPEKVCVVYPRSDIGIFF